MARDPYKRANVTARAIGHGLVGMGVGRVAGSVAGHALGHEQLGSDIGHILGTTAGFRHGIRSAHDQNAAVDQRFDTHGPGLPRQSLVGRGAIGWLKGRIGGAATGTAHAILAGHQLGSPEHFGTMAKHMDVLGVAGAARGVVHAARHNVLVNILAHARAEKAHNSLAGAVHNAQFEAHHHRVHGRFQ